MTSIERKKVIMVLGAGQYQTDVIKKLRASGFYVVALDRDGSAVGFSEADKGLAVDISDKEAVFECAAKVCPDGIMPMNDFGTRAAFYACQKLGLIGPSYLSGICGNDKGIMREIWSHENLPQPHFKVISIADPRTVFDEGVSYPCIVKPADSGGGGRGISVVHAYDDLADAIAHAEPFAARGRVLIEEFIEGTEVTVESLIYKGEVHNLAISDKIKVDSRFRVATSLNYPADFSEDIIARVFDIVTRAVECLGVSNGAAHTELIISHDLDRISLVETGLRGGGGHVFGTIIEEVTGISGPVQLANILCGLSPELVPTRNMGCVYRFFNPPGRGQITSISYDKNLVEGSQVAAFGITIKVGQIFEGLIDSMRRVGFVVTRGSDRAQAIKIADNIESSVCFEVK